MRFNDDQGGTGSSNTYIRHYSYSAPASGSSGGGSWTDQEEKDGVNIYANDGKGANYAVVFINNYQDTEKLFTWKTVEEGDGTGAGEPVNSVESVGKWVNSDDQINRIAIDAGSGNTFASGTEMIVLGYDYDEAITGTAYWQQLDTTTLDTDDTGGGSASDPQMSVSWTGGYKYLWVQGFIGCSTDWKTSFGEVDGSGDYTWNYQDDSGSYTNVGSTESSAGFHVSGSGRRTSLDSMIINNSGKEKLYWVDGICTASSGTASPTNRHVFGKGTFGTGQINSIEFYVGSGTFYADSNLTVWGAN